MRTNKNAQIDAGKVFDNSLYLIPEWQVKKCIEHYFSQEELKNKVILDAGCRLGEYSNYFAAITKSVIGIDLSGKSIKLALENNMHKNLEFVQGDILNLSKFTSSSFDIIFCIGTMPYIAPINIENLILEFKRCCKPSGTILLLFQKPKGLLGKTARFIANSLPFRLWMSITNNLSPFFVYPASVLLHRVITKEYIKYGIFLSLRGVNFGVPLDFQNKYHNSIVRTAECENLSEETTVSYKIVNNK